MILLTIGLVLAACAVVVWAANRRRLSRLAGPRRCGACAHALAPGQDRCPECGRAWGSSDPGAARVFGAVADRCERARRATVVSLWALALAAAAAVALGCAYIGGALPSTAATNASWCATVQAFAPNAAWGLDVEMIVLVRGVRARLDEFSAGAAFERVDEVHIARVSATRSAESPTDLHGIFAKGTGVFIRRLHGDRYSVLEVPADSGSWGGSRARVVDEITLAGSGHESWRALQGLQFSFLTHFGEHASYGEIQQTRVLQWVSELCDGDDMRIHIRPGENHTTYVPPHMALRARSTREQSVLGAGLAGASLLLVAVAWLFYWCARPITNPRSA